MLFKAWMLFFLISHLLTSNQFEVLARPSQEKSSAVTYYISPDGKDSASGKSIKTPWKTLKPLEGKTFEPGTTIKLRRGGQWKSPLLILSSGLIVTSYGHGSQPLLTRGCVTLKGDLIELKEITIARCKGKTGVIVEGNHNKINNLTVTKNAIGVYVAPGANGTIIEKSNIVKNNRMMVNTPCDENCNDDYGAQGINIWGNNTIVRWNYFSHNYSKSFDYGKDGSSVEIFEGRNSRIYSNKALDEMVFSELGGVNVKASDNTFKNNKFYSSLPSASFIVTRGEGIYWGPVWNTKLFNNVAILKGHKSIALYCEPGCGPDVLSASKNLFLGEGAAWINPSSMAGGSNLYCGLWLDGVSTQPGDKVKVLNSLNQSYKDLERECRS